MSEYIEENAKTYKGKKKNLLAYILRIVVGRVALRQYFFRRCVIMWLIFFSFSFHKFFLFFPL